MTSVAGRVARRAIESSRVVSLSRRVAGESLVCGALARAGRQLGQVRDRAGAGLPMRGVSIGPEALAFERLDALAANSRVMHALSALFVTPTLSAREARIGRLMVPFLSLDLQARFRTAAYAGIIAVVTHTMLLAALGVPVYLLGWSARAVVVVAGLIVLAWPDAFAAAWKDKN